MTSEDSLPPPTRRSALHYHGDTVRILFIVAAFLMLAAETTGASLPHETLAIVTFAVVLVVLAGITNPAQEWIHFVNAGVAIFGAIDFGLYAIGEYQGARDFFALNYLYGEALALVFLIAVYFVTKTVRGFLLRTHLT